MHLGLIHLLLYLKKDKNIASGGGPAPTAKRSVRHGISGGSGCLLWAEVGFARWDGPGICSPLGLMFEMTLTRIFPRCKCDLRSGRQAPLVRDVAPPPPGLRGAVPRPTPSVTPTRSVAEGPRPPRGSAARPGARRLLTLLCPGPRRLRFHRACDGVHSLTPMTFSFNCRTDAKHQFQEI